MDPKLLKGPASFWSLAFDQTDTPQCLLLVWGTILKTPTCGGLSKAHLQLPGLHPRSSTMATEHG